MTAGIVSVNLKGSGLKIVNCSNTGVIEVNKEHCNLSALSAQRIWNTVDKVSAGALQRPLSDDVSGHRRQYLYLSLIHI